MLITLTWILGRWTISQTAGDQSKPTPNVPPATFTLRNMLFKMEHFHLVFLIILQAKLASSCVQKCQMKHPSPSASPSLLGRVSCYEEVETGAGLDSSLGIQGRQDIGFMFKTSILHPPFSPTWSSTCVFLFGNMFMFLQSHAPQIPTPIFTLMHLITTRPVETYPSVVDPLPCLCTLSTPCSPLFRLEQLHEAFFTVLL